MSEKATFGLPKNIAAALSYVGLSFTGILFYIFERENKFVKFHAMQSIIFFGAMAVLNYVLKFALAILRFIPLLGGLFGFLGGIVIYLIGIASMIAWVWLIFNAIQGREYQIPVIGKIVSAHINK